MDGPQEPRRLLTRMTFISSDPDRRGGHETETQPGTVVLAGSLLPARWSQHPLSPRGCPCSGRSKGSVVNAIFTKLRNRTWVLRVTGGTPTPGMAIQVSKGDGTVVTKTVSSVLWSGNGVVLCSVVNDKKPAAVTPPPKASAPPARRCNWRPCGYPGCIQSYCDGCDGEGGDGRRSRSWC
jgi:hypothetical protein